MGSNWLIYSLGDLIDVKHGFAFKGEYMRDDIEHGPIVVAIGNFDYNGGFRFSETKLKDTRLTTLKILSYRLVTCFLL